MMPSNVALRNSGAASVPTDASHELYEESMPKVEDGLMAAMGLIPPLATCGIKQMIHGW